jgi:hypothetical protein
MRDLIRWQKERLLTVLIMESYVPGLREERRRDEDKVYCF